MGEFSRKARVRLRVLASQHDRLRRLLVKGVVVPQQQSHCQYEGEGGWRKGGEGCVSEKRFIFSRSKSSTVHPQTLVKRA